MASKLSKMKRDRTPAILYFLFCSIVGFCLSFVLVSCQLGNFIYPTRKTAPIPPLKEIRIGIHPVAAHLYVLKESRALEKRLAPQGISVRWVKFSSGMPIATAMGKNEIDLGVFGGVPPLVAQARDIPLIYIANEPPEQVGGRILVREDSPIKTVADLKGKKVAVPKASQSFYTLFQILRNNFLTLDEVQIVDLLPPAGQAALRKKEVDAWVGSQPFLAELEKSLPIRLLATGKGVSRAYTYYLTTRSFASDRSDIIPVVIDEIRKIGIWVRSHPDRAAEIFAASMKLDKSVALLSIVSFKYGATEIQDRAIEEQQRIADTFFRLGILPKQIRVEDFVWKGRLNQ